MKSDWLYSLQSNMENLYTVSKTRPGTDCGSDHEFLIAKFRLKLKKAGKITRPFRYDLNQVPYDYTEMKWSELAQLCLTLCDPVDPPGSSIHGIHQARVLEWVAISFSRGSSRPRNRTQVSHIAGRRFNLWATRDAHTEEVTNRFKG